MQEDLESQAQPANNEIRGGYPRFTTLLTSDKAFRVFRRFTRVRMRLVLAQQDKVFMLEEQLEATDLKEQRRLFLGNMRMDRNKKRRRLLIDLKAALREYDTLIEQTRLATLLPDPDLQDVQGLKDWLRGTGFNRAETAYLEDHSDLASLAGSSDSAVKSVETLLVKYAACCSDLLGHRLNFLRYKPNPKSSDQNVKVFIAGPLSRGFSRIIAVCLVALIMLVPTLVLPRLQTAPERAAASVITAAAVLMAVAFFTRARTVELAACGASYTAVIVALTAAMPTSAGISISHSTCNSTTN